MKLIFNFLSFPISRTQFSFCIIKYIPKTFKKVTKNEKQTKKSIRKDIKKIFLHYFMKRGFFILLYKSLFYFFLYIKNVDKIL